MSNMNQNNDMQRLQQEAMRRAREIQSKARYENTDKNDDSKLQDNTETQEQNDEIVSPQHNLKPTSIPKNKIANIPMDLLDSIMKDKDKNLILILILILAGENADSSLILALLYLLL